MVLISSNRRVTTSGINKLANKFRHYRMEDCPIKEKIDEIISEFTVRFDEIERERDDRIKALEGGRDVELGAIKKVKVYVAKKT